MIFNDPFGFWFWFWKWVFYISFVGVYSLCDGPRLSRGPYLGVTTMCSVLSLLFVSFKAVYVFGNGSGYVGGSEIALFVCSCVLAVGHVVVAYRTSCRERRKLLVYKIDIEAVSVPFNPYTYHLLWHINYWTLMVDHKICILYNNLFNVFTFNKSLILHSIYFFNTLIKL